MADFFDVDLREILDGERKREKMNEELKETVLKVAEYSNEEKKRSTRFVLIYFVLGILYATGTLNKIAAFKKGCLEKRIPYDV